jgi:acyl carrier protein
MSIHGVFHRVDQRLARATSRLRLRQANELGEGPTVTGSPHLENRGRLEIGRAFHLSATPAMSHMVVGRGARLSIGDRVSIGDGAAIACTHDIRIGSDVHVGRNIMVLDTDFHVAHAMTTQGASAAIVIEDGVRIEDDVIVLKGSSLGAGAHVASGSVVSGVVAPRSHVAGVPARAVLRRDGASLFTGDVTERVRAVMEHSLALDGLASLAEVDSLAALRLLLALEDEFGVTLPDGAASQLQSVDAVARIVEQATSRA